MIVAPLDPRAPAAQLVDLSQPIRNGMFHGSHLPAPALTKLRSIASNGMSITHASFHAHTGTHVDAPSHFLLGGESITDVSLDRFVGQGIVVPVKHTAGEEIAVDEVVPQVEAFGPHAMVCLQTGWDSKIGKASEYGQHPFLSVELAHALVQLQVRMLVLDTPSPDMPDGVRPKGFDWPVHKVLMEGGVLITEQVRGLNEIRGRPFRLHALPIALTGSDGAPARVVAEVSQFDRLDEV